VGFLLPQSASLSPIPLSFTFVVMNWLFPFMQWKGVWSPVGKKVTSKLKQKNTHQGKWRRLVLLPLAVSYLLNQYIMTPCQCGQIILYVLQKFRSIVSTINALVYKNNKLMNQHIPWNKIKIDTKGHLFFLNWGAPAPDFIKNETKYHLRPLQLHPTPFLQTPKVWLNRTRHHTCISLSKFR
jgi:hypothetical protein